MGLERFWQKREKMTKHLRRRQQLSIRVGSNTEDPSMQQLNDEELIRQAEDAFLEEKLLEAARLLEQVQDKSTLTAKHNEMRTTAADFSKALDDMLVPAEGGDWIKQGESHGKRDTVIYYRLEDNGAKLSCRIETPVEADLVIPLLSVLNEVELYDTWIPSISFPFRIGVNSTERYEQASRLNQTFSVVVDCPWPFEAREAVIHAVAIDAIEAKDCILVRLAPRNNEDGTDPVVPPVKKGITRVDFDGTVLIRPCPANHVLVADKTQEERAAAPILISFQMFVDPKMGAVPVSISNFITRTVIGGVWGMLLRVAEKVRVGRLPQHKAVIDARADLYDWIRVRMEGMFEKLQRVSADKDNEKLIAYLQT